MGRIEKEFDFKSPYPNLGEVLRALAVSMDVKSSDRELDKYAREGESDAELKDRLIEKLFRGELSKRVSSSFARMFAHQVELFLTDYIDLILELGLDGIKREQSLPILVRHFFSWKASCFLNEVAAEWGGPKPHFMVASGAISLDVVFAWFEQECEGFSEGLNKLDKPRQDQIRNWRHGYELPLLLSIVQIGEKLIGTDPEKEFWLERFKVCVLVARSITWFARQFENFDASEVIRGHLWSGRSHLNYMQLIEQDHLQNVVHMRPLALAGVELKSLLALDRQRKEGEKDALFDKIKEFEDLLRQLDPDGLTGYWLDWQLARWHLFASNLKEAVNYYEGAFYKSIYCAGKNQLQIIKEALVAVARLGANRPLLKRLKQQAVIFGQFNLLYEPDYLSINKSKDLKLEDWEVSHWSSLYDQLFPSSAHFPETVVDNETFERLGPLIIGPEDWERKPDFRNPDREIKVGATWKKKMSQLNWFSEINKPEYVEALLNKGASPDVLSDSGDSPLLTAIAEISETGDRRCYDLLKLVRHDERTVNVRTVKKRLTPLSCAIETCDPDVVRQVIAMGAEVDRKAQTVLHTPLYQCMTYFALLHRSEQSISLDMVRLYFDDPATLESIRRHSGGLAGVDHRDVIKFKNEYLEGIGPRKGRIFDAVFDHYYGKLVNRLSQRNLLEIVSILLESGADPNIPQKSPVKGYTPFMLAAENDAVEAFAIMAESTQKKGNIYQTVLIDGKSEDCWSIAYKWRSSKVLAYMQRKYGR